MANTANKLGPKTGPSGTNIQIISWREEGVDIQPAPIDLSSYERPEQLERLGPRRLTGALKWLGFHEDTMPRNGVQLARRLFSTKGIPLEQITEDFFEHWVDDHVYVEAQYLDLRKITKKSQVEELGQLRVRAALKALGLKSGGTLFEIAERLFLTRGVPREKLPESFFPNQHGQRSTAKHKRLKKEVEIKMKQGSFVGTDKDSRYMEQILQRRGNTFVQDKWAGKSSGRKKTGSWNKRSMAPSPPPPPPPPRERSPPPPPPPPPPSERRAPSGVRQSQAYGSSQSTSSPYASSFVASTPMAGTGTVAAAVATAPAQTAQWPGQNYPPPSTQLYAPQKYNMYQPGTLSGHAYVAYPSGTAGTAAGYTSTGTYIQPSATATPAVSGTTYVVDTSSLPGNVEYPGASTSATPGYPTTATTIDYQTQPTGGATAGSNYRTQSIGRPATASNYLIQSTGGATTTDPYSSYQTQSSSTAGRADSSNTYDDASVSSNWPDQEPMQESTETFLGYTTTKWAKSDRSDHDSFKTTTSRQPMQESTLDDSDDYGPTANSWLTTYGKWDTTPQPKERSPDPVTTEKKSRWSSASEGAKGLTVGRGLTNSKFKMIQCKDCNVFLSSNEQYKEHMVSESHILKVGGDLAAVRAAQEAQEEVERPRFNPLWRKGGMQEEPMSQETIDAIEERKARMFSMRYEVKLTGVRDREGFAPGRFGKMGRGGRKRREQIRAGGGGKRGEMIRAREEHRKTGKVTRPDDEDEIFRQLPSQLEKRGLGFVEGGRRRDFEEEEYKEEPKLESFVKKGELHMDTGMRLYKYLKKKNAEEMGAPALPESGVPQFGMAPPPKSYDRPRQSLIAKKFGKEEFKISFDTEEDIMRAAVVIPLLVPYLDIPGMNEIKEALAKGAKPPESQNVGGQDLLDCVKNITSTLKNKDDSKTGNGNGDKDNETPDKEVSDKETTKELDKKVSGSGSARGNTGIQDFLLGQAGYSEPVEEVIKGPSRDDKLLVNLSSVMDKPDVLHNPAVLSFLAQAQPSVVAKVKHAKPILKRLPQHVVEEIIFKAHDIADNMERQIYWMQEAMEEHIQRLYGGPGLLGEQPGRRKPHRRIPDLLRIDMEDETYYDYDDDFDDDDEFDRGYNDDLYRRRFGCDEDDDFWGGMEQQGLGEGPGDFDVPHGPRGMLDRGPRGPRDMPFDDDLRDMMMDRERRGMPFDDDRRHMPLDRDRRGISLDRERRDMMLDREHRGMPFDDEHRRMLLDCDRGGMMFDDHRGMPLDHDRRGMPFDDNQSKPQTSSGDDYSVYNRAKMGLIKKGGNQAKTQTPADDGYSAYNRAKMGLINFDDDRRRMPLDRDRRGMSLDRDRRGMSLDREHRGMPFDDELGDMPFDDDLRDMMMDRERRGIPFDNIRDMPFNDRRDMPFGDDHRGMSPGPGRFGGPGRMDDPKFYRRMKEGGSLNEDMKRGRVRNDDDEDDDEYSNYKRYKMRYAGGEEDGKKEEAKEEEPEEEVDEEALERKRALRRQRKQEKKKARQAEAEEDDDEDGGTVHHIRSTLPPQLLAAQMKSDSHNQSKTQTSSGDDYSVYNRAKMGLIKKGGNQAKPDSLAKRIDEGEVQSQTSGKKPGGNGQAKPSHPIRSALPAQLLGASGGPKKSVPVHPVRSALPAQLLATSGGLKKSVPEHPVHSVLPAQLLGASGGQKKTVPVHPARSALPAQLLATSGGPKKSVPEHPVQSAPPAQLLGASKPKKRVPLLRSSLPAKFLWEIKVDVYKEKKKQQAARRGGQAAQPIKSGNVGKSQLVLKSKDQEPPKSGDATPSRPIRSAIPPQGGQAAQPIKSGNVGTNQGAQKSKAESADATPVQPIRSAIPPQLLAAMSSKGSSKKVEPPSARTTRSKASLVDKSKMAKQQQNTDKEEHMEVDEPSHAQPLSTMVKSPDADKGALKTFTIPKKQTPPKKKGVQDKPRPIRSTLPPQMLTAENTTPKATKGQKKQTKKSAGTKEVKSHPIRSAIPAQMLGQSSSDEESDDGGARKKKWKRIK